MAVASAEAGPSKPSPPLRSRSSSPASDLSVNRDGEVNGQDELSEGMESDYETDSDTVRGQTQDAKSKDFKGKSIADSYSARPPARSQSSDPRVKEQTTRSWAELDLSIIVACVSPIGNWLTGGDHIKNLFLIILLIFYLHQLVEVPWNLYQASLPRKSAHSRSTQAPTDRTTTLAATELRRQELFYLILTVLSPLCGAVFLHHVLDALGGAESLSWFSTTLFVLATGIRPWSHLVTRLRERTHALHDAVHYPPSSAPSPADEELARVTRRISALENEMKELRARTVYAGRLQSVCDDLSEAVGELERGSKMSERKAETLRLKFGARFAALESGLVQLEQNRRIEIDILKATRSHELPFYITTYRRVRSYVAPFLAGVLRIPKAIWALGALDSDITRLGDSPASGHVYPMGILKNGNGSGNGNGNGAMSTAISREKGSPRLPTIPEAAHSDPDADSEGTYVSDKEKDAPSSPPTHIGSKEKRMQSRSRSRSGGRKIASKGTQLTKSQWAFEYAQSIVLWPYRASVRILLMVAPPLRRILPRYL